MYIEVMGWIKDNLDVITGVGSIASPLVGAGIGVWQADLERRWAAEQAQINRDFQVSEREATQDWNLAQWNRENAYNSPEAQMERMVRAGINPNVAAQAIGGNATSAGQVRSSAQSGSQASAPGSIASSLMQTLGNSANQFWQNQMLQKEVVGKDIENKFAPEMNRKQIQLTEETINKTVKETLGVEASTEQVKELTRWIPKQNEAQLRLVEQQINELIANIQLTNQKTKTEEQNTALVGETVETQEQQTEVTRYQVLTELWRGLSIQNEAIFGGEVQKYEAAVAAFKSSLLEQGIDLSAGALQCLIGYIGSGHTLSELLDKVGYSFTGGKGLLDPGTIQQNSDGTYSRVDPGLVQSFTDMIWRMFGTDPVAMDMMINEFIKRGVNSSYMPWN